ncbi:hypothetical protein JTE90_019977 [Oedothorax gibbosus]|uniref:Uncharacterized protein n=1 Tax=Oedothorax gibbosus TaxID=931172 RepID=A0AAV6TE37_9ARAC|nr:hypothetical protein JTE90_019977 [Oedothorax gibbosus]
MNRRSPAPNPRSQGRGGRWRLGVSVPETDSEQVTLTGLLPKVGARPLAARFYPDASSLESGCLEVL